MESILTSIKKLLGIESEYTHFDPDIIIHINSALMTLTQLGVGPDVGFLITGVDEKWTDFLGDRKDVAGVKTYVLSKVRLVFDPPSNGYLVEAIERQIKELEWRLNVQVDKPVADTTITEGEV